MRYPSVNTLEKHLSLNRTDALKLRKLLDGRLDPMTFASVQKWVKQCYNQPKHLDLVMEAANELLGGYGIEAIRGEWQNGFWCDVRAVYVNMGDTYTSTLLYDRDSACYRVMSWGDFVEWCQRKGEKFE